MKWTEINWSEVSWGLIRVLTLLGLVGGGSGGSYYYASQKVEEKAAEVVQGRQQEQLGESQLIAELSRRLRRMEDEQDRHKDELRALWRQLSKKADEKSGQSQSHEREWINPRGGRYAQQNLERHP